MPSLRFTAFADAAEGYPSQRQGAAKAVRVSAFVSSAPHGRSEPCTDLAVLLQALALRSSPCPGAVVLRSRLIGEWAHKPTAHAWPEGLLAVTRKHCRNAKRAGRWPSRFSHLGEVLEKVEELRLPWEAVLLVEGHMFARLLRRNHRKTRCGFKRRIRDRGNGLVFGIGEV